MKKALSILIAAALITLPGYQCVANNGFVITPDYQPMGKLAKLAVLTAMSVGGAFGVKAFNWYQHKNALDILNEEYPLPKGLVPADTDTIVFAQWGVDKYPTIADLWSKKDEVSKELRELSRRKPIQPSSLGEDVKKAIGSELRAAAAVCDALSPYTTYNQEIDHTLRSMTQQQLDAYYAAIKIKEAAKVKDVASPGAFECSSQYAWKAAYYALGKAQQLAAWVTRKPTISEETKNRFVAVLKGYHRLQILYDIIDKAIKSEIQRCEERRLVNNTAPVVHHDTVAQEVSTPKSNLTSNLTQQIKSNPALAAIAGLGLFSGTLFACDYIFN